MEKRNGKLMPKDECLAFDKGVDYEKQRAGSVRYIVGPNTLLHVFRENDQTNLSNLQLFLDQVELKLEELTKYNELRQIDRRDVDRGILMASGAVEQKLQVYIQDHGNYDNDTGFTEFNEAGQQYVGELEEIVEMINGLRSIDPPVKIRPVSDNALQEKFRADATPLWREIYDALRDHSLSNMMEVDGQGFYPLVDRLSRDGGGVSIMDGEEEIASIVDLVHEIIAKKPELLTLDQMFDDGLVKAEPEQEMIGTVSIPDPLDNELYPIGHPKNPR